MEERLAALHAIVELWITVCPLCRRDAELLRGAASEKAQLPRASIFVSMRVNEHEVWPMKADVTRINHP
eukprot:4313302-Amphidinium_carterae.1